MLISSEIRHKFITFFESKGCRPIASASLIPENDSTTLFIGSGMQPLLPYLLGATHPAGKRLVNSQKSFRSEDIDEVGDGRHNTVFEMLGDWSLGDFFKAEQLSWIFEFLTVELGLDPNRLYISVFQGNSELNIARDTEAVDIWQKLFRSLGVEAKDVADSETKGMRDGRIFYYGEKKNWWSRAGVPSNMPVGEPGGPDSEMFWDLGSEIRRHEQSVFADQPCHVNCDCGRFIEIGNNVFMQYVKTETGFQELAQKNIDFGGGLERIVMAAQGQHNVFETDCFNFIIRQLEAWTGLSYQANIKPFEVIADHLKAATFIIGDDKGVKPSNTDQGYIVRRLVRRAIRFGRQLDLQRQNWTGEIAQLVINNYKNVYPELERNAAYVIEQLNQEEQKFKRTLENGVKEIEKLRSKGAISGKEAFNLYQSFGFPIEMTQEFAAENAITVDVAQFYVEQEYHQELSRTASKGKFKGGLADSSEETTKLHTLAHLLLAALRRVLGEHVYQKGSNITSERLRYDFSHPEKLTDNQKQQVEDLVNQAIAHDYPITYEEISREEAERRGAVGVFEEKYGGMVKVYLMGTLADHFSNELCGGPHVTNTGTLGKIRITKEESVSSGVRRIKAVLE